MKTQDYLDVFARFKQKENIEAVERTLAVRTELELFERAQLGMSCHYYFSRSSSASKRNEMSDVVS